MTILLIWTRRNQVRVGDNPPPLWKVSALALDNLLEFQRAAAVLPLTSKIPTNDRWLPPPGGWMKVNFDRAIFREKSLVG